MRSARLTMLSILLIVALLLVGCAPAATPASTAATPASGAATKTLKIGVMGPFSGPAARTGQELKSSAQMAFEAIDYKIGPYKVEFVYIDSQSDPAKAAQAYEQAAVQGNIQAGLLQWHSSTAVSCMEVAAKYKIPHFFGYGATEVVNEKYASDPSKYGYWIKGWPTPAKLIVPYVQAIEDSIARGIWKPANKTIAVYGEDTDLGRSFGKALKDQFTAVGWKVVAEEYFPIDQTEFYPLLGKLKDLNPALIAGTLAAPPTVAAFAKQSDELGVKSLIIVDGLGWIGEWYDLAGKSANYILDQIPGWSTDKAKKFATDFEKKYGIKPSASAAGLSYDASNMFIEMLKATYAQYKELNRETIYKWSQENLITGKWTYKDGIIMQEYKYTPETVPDMVVGKGYFIFPVLQYFDGNSKVVFPPEWREQDLKVKP